MVNPNLHLADFLKTNLAKCAAIRVKEDQKTPDKLENNHTSEAESKGKEKLKRRPSLEEERRRREKLGNVSTNLHPLFLLWLLCR